MYSLIKPQWEKDYCINSSPSSASIPFLILLSFLPSFLIEVDQIS